MARDTEKAPDVIKYGNRVIFDRKVNVNFFIVKVQFECGQSAELNCIPLESSLNVF